LVHSIQQIKSNLMIKGIKADVAIVVFNVGHLGGSGWKTRRGASTLAMSSLKKSSWVSFENQSSSPHHQHLCRLPDFFWPPDFDLLCAEHAYLEIKFLSNKKYNGSHEISRTAKGLRSPKKALKAKICENLRSSILMKPLMAFEQRWIMKL